MPDAVRSGSHNDLCAMYVSWLGRAAERCWVSHTIAAGRHRSLGAAGMADQSSGPPHSRRRTALWTERRIVAQRVASRTGWARIAWRLGINSRRCTSCWPSTGALGWPAWDRSGGVPVRRSERSAPGKLVHADVEKLDGPACGERQATVAGVSEARRQQL
jgi:hypothetical protein